MDIKILLGNNIRKFRKLRGLSQEELAEISNLHRTYLGSVERGERNITIDNIQRIAKALNINVKQLFEEER